MYKYRDQGKHFIASGTTDTNVMNIAQELKELKNVSADLQSKIKEIEDITRQERLARKELAKLIEEEIKEFLEVKSIDI